MLKKLGYIQKTKKKNKNNFILKKVFKDLKSA